MQRGVRFFYIMGTSIILFAFWSLLVIPWDALEEMSPEFAWLFVYTFVVQLSVGITEIAVGWLVNKELSRGKGSPSYRCQRCGYEFPKAEATISGWDSQSSLRHVHCLRCGKIITHAP